MRLAFGSLRLAWRRARTEEKVRGFLAVALVLVLIALVFNTPGDSDTAIAAVASTKTLAIAVVAFYFGLHKGTPQRSPARSNTPGTDDVGP